MLIVWWVTNYHMVMEADLKMCPGIVDLYFQLMMAFLLVLPLEWRYPRFACPTVMGT
jgi:hypothetical protein